MNAETAVAAAVPAIVRHRWRWYEALPWLAAIAAFFLLPGYLAFGTQIAITILFVLSLDLIVGYAGIVTLGHAAFFGLGAYAVGLLSIHADWHEPLTLLAAAGVVAAAGGALTGWFLLRYHGLTLIMLTLASAMLLHETVNAGAAVTGGYDGLTGIRIAPLFGVFDNDLWARTYYCYSVGVLFLCFLVVRRLVHAPFGLSLQGIRGNARRMSAIGYDVHRRMVAVYTLSAGLAGLAGGLLAQFSAFVTIDTLSFARSGTALVMLVLGGTGRLYGAFFGVLVYMVLEHELAKLSPAYWGLGVGMVLLAIVLLARGGLCGILARLARR